MKTFRIPAHDIKPLATGLGSCNRFRQNHRRRNAMGTYAVRILTER